MHQSNKVYLKDRQRRLVRYSSKVNITLTKMLGETLMSDISVTILRLTGAIKIE